MEPFDALSLCGEVAIAITGFSGVVLVFGRHGDDATRIESILFRTLFSGSLIALALVAVASILHGAGLAAPLTWRLCSGFHAIALVASVFFSRPSWPDEGDRGPAIMGRGGPVILIGAITSVSLSIANAIWIQAFWPVVTVVWWAIAVSLWAFVSLVFRARGA